MFSCPKKMSPDREPLLNIDRSSQESTQRAKRSAFLEENSDNPYGFNENREDCCIHDDTDKIGGNNAIKHSRHCVAFKTNSQKSFPSSSPSVKGVIPTTIPSHQTPRVTLPITRPLTGSDTKPYKRRQVDPSFVSSQKR